MLKLKHYLVVGLLSCVAGTALAADKIAVVNVQRAIVETDAAKERLESLRQEADFKSNMKEVEEIKKEGQSLVEKLKKESTIERFLPKGNGEKRQRWKPYERNVKKA